MGRQPGFTWTPAQHARLEQAVLARIPLVTRVVVESTLRRVRSNVEHDLPLTHGADPLQTLLMLGVPADNTERRMI